MRHLILATLLLVATAVAPARADVAPANVAPAQAGAQANVAPAQAGAQLPPRIQAPTDKATFRRFTLDNGMKVLLVSDPNYNKSAASLVVDAGTIDDPAQTEGLAHFLEHMLFLGTEKYPDPGEYVNYMNANGGRRNAYTSTDHTNYHFEVRHGAFEGGLDRFAQFFIAPKFNPEFVGREVNAVHNEAMRHVQNDLRRMLNVSRELYDPSSGESRFSTGNKDTLAQATPQAVRAFYETHYSADRMALALASTASLDDMERWVRQDFSAVPKRDLPPLVRVSRFLPPKPALRLAFVEPVKEVRTLTLEFPVPGTRADFVSKPDRIVQDLINDAGPGGLRERLKREGLATAIEAELWERTSAYGSMFVTVSLTPQGRTEYERVLRETMAYLDYLRTAPYPADFYAQHAKTGALRETYADRGEGMALATKLANNTLWYPLDVAERATDAWGAPDEAAYRRLLGALRADNVLVTLVAKGVQTDRKERIYGTAYSYREETGAAYAALAHPQKIAYALPGANPFMPAKVALVPERPLALVDEPGLKLYYAEDVEFQRPATTFIFRFVPVREMATADSAALLRLYLAGLQDYLEPALQEAQRAGTNAHFEASIEGLKVTVGGFGDSPARLAHHIAASLRTFTVPPARFDALKELRLRELRSYAETEAYQLARDRRNAMSREFDFLPPQMVAATEKASWADVQAFARRFFARGKLEVLAHGAVKPEDSVAVARDFAASVGAEGAPEKDLVRRRHIDIARAENLVDVGEVAGVNSAFVTDYVLPDDSPATRAATLVASNFISEPFFSELRTRQQLGYIVGASAAASQRERFLTFVVQSSGYGPDELRKRSETFIATLPDRLAATTDAQWATLVAGARSTLSEKPKSIAEKAELFFEYGYTYGGEWDRRESALAALDTLTREQAVTLLKTALGTESARRRSVLLYTKAHPLAETVTPSFTELDTWKATRKYE
jgi:secreted Zn-dependent insulinase-like peptidase